MSSAALGALTRATSLVAEGLPEERLAEQLARCAADALGAHLCAIFLLPEHAPLGVRQWRLVGSMGADTDVLAAFPITYGQACGVLAPLFENTRELYEPDVLNGAPADSPLPPQLPIRSVAGVPIRRRDGRSVGAFVAGARQPHAFDDQRLATTRALAQLAAIGIDNARLAASQQRERRMAAESAVTLGTVLESVDSGICVVDLDGTLRMANKSWHELFGLAEPTTGMPQDEVFAGASIRPSDHDGFLARLRELNADPSQVDESDWELATDPPRIVQRHAAPMRNLLAEVVGRVEVYTDITETRRLYTQLLNSEKLRAIGEMASGVAHDFNNLLASIVGQTDLLPVDDLPTATRQAIATIRQAALDGARMVRSLQGLARPRLETPSTTADLNDAVLLAAEMARPRWSGAALRGGGPIELRLNLADPSTISRVAVDPAELREVLLNLLFNAADAMPEGGLIEIATRPSRTPGSADLEVRDTGHGMPESVRARIFEPFYSTKGARGSGLGLAVAYSVISRRGGEIGVESKVGAGTTFTLRLPYVPSPAGGSSAPRPSVPKPERVATTTTSASALALKGARILVADDEPGLVTIVRQLMQRSGAEVTIADGGRAALAALRMPDARFDVVITDLDMPEIDGWAVTAEAKARQPGIHVVMLTGWAGEVAPEDFTARGVDVVLAKPCSRADLESAIAGLLKPAPRASNELDVLLCDDEAVFARSIRDLLGLMGHRVTVVDSAPAALEALQGQRYDVLLTDYSLGEITGAQLADEIADREMPDPPFVVLITGYATEIDDPSLLTRGISAVLPKPCRRDDLQQVLGRVRPSPA